MQSYHIPIPLLRRAVKRSWVIIDLNSNLFVAPLRNCPPYVDSIDLALHFTSFEAAASTVLPHQEDVIEVIR